MSYTSSTILDPLKFDPRLEVGAYITDGNNLYEVVSRMSTYVMLENCISDICQGTAAWCVLVDYELVRRAPEAPDFVEMCIGDAA